MSLDFSSFFQTPICCCFANKTCPLHAFILINNACNGQLLKTVKFSTAAMLVEGTFIGWLNRFQPNWLWLEAVQL
jgi:hypothetical protein